MESIALVKGNADFFNIKNLYGIIITVRSRKERSMPDHVSQIIYRFSQELRKILGNKLSKVIVYGSYARGDYNDCSDVDVMVLVKMSDEEIRAVKNEIYDIAFDIQLSTDIEISPIIKNEEQYEYWVDTLPFYRNVREEGVVISER